MSIVYSFLCSVAFYPGTCTPDKQELLFHDCVVVVNTAHNSVCHINLHVLGPLPIYALYICMYSVTI